MKKVLTITTAAAVAVGMMSCKKDYTCTCEIDGVETTTVTYKNVTKKEAEESCDASHDISLLMSCKLVD